MTLRSVLAVLVVLTAQNLRAADTERPCPFAAHNCYSDVSVQAARHRLAEALQVGLRYIEVDVNHQPEAGGFVVTHKSENAPTEPLLQEFLKPLWEKWRAEPFEHLLIVDFKAGRPDAVASTFHAYLSQYRDVLCTFAPDGSPKAKGPVAVCLTGSGHLGRAYINHARAQGELLARRDQGFSGAAARPALRQYLQRPPEPGVGYLTVEWNVVIPKGKPYAAPLSSEDRTWLAEIVAGAKRHQYGLRFYTLNTRETYRKDAKLTSGDWDTHWAACVRAGVDMIATDQYSLGVQWWEQIGKAIKADR